MKVQVTVVLLFCIYFNWPEVMTASNPAEPDVALKPIYCDVSGLAFKLKVQLQYKKRQIKNCCYYKSSKHSCCMKRNEAGELECHCSPDTDCGRCPQDWIFYRKTDNSTKKCLKVFTSKQSFDSSVSNCETTTGTLAKINTQELINFAKEKVVNGMNGPDDKFWFNLNENADTDGNPITVDDWATSGQDVGSGQCGLIDGTANSQWNVDSCSTSYKHICERPVPDPNAAPVVHP